MPSDASAVESLTARTPGAGPTTCALEGCGAPVERRAGGGRPRLYCSDAHRALARRRRLRQPAGEPDPLVEARALLVRAVERLEQASAASPAPEDPAAVAEARARATAEVLAAQQVAARAARDGAAARRRLEAERAEWETERRALHARNERDETEIARLAAETERLAGALEGARAELETELLRHHRDVEELQAALERRSPAGP